MKYEYDLEITVEPFTYLVSGVVTYRIKEGEPADEYSPGYRDEAEDIDATVKKAECMDDEEQPWELLELVGEQAWVMRCPLVALEAAVNSHFEEDDEELVKHAVECGRADYDKTRIE
jgi:hypothetical protein